LWRLAKRNEEELVTQARNPKAIEEGWTLWLTGLPASGKSTIARALQQQLHGPVVVLDSDEVRPILASVHGYDEAGREEFYARLVQLALLLVKQGINVIVAATANRRQYRRFARASLPRFAEVWVKSPVSVCQSRDPKGLYRRAAAGEIRNLPGFDSEYEASEDAESVVDSSQLAPDAAAAAILAAIPFLASP
jgi:adenylylsulfate kinase